jgi:hypothetical protein
MGGQAFTHLSPHLQTPRMSPEIYTQVLATTHAILRQHYHLVGSPIESPGKETFGDVDVVVFSPKADSPLNGIISYPDLAKQLSIYLGAKHHITEKGNPTLNFAIPWPAEESLDEDGEEEKAVKGKKYVQLDVKICDSEKMFQWELFHAAHGDLWNILRSTIRRFGLVVNNLGMYLRIPEIEPFDRRKSMVLLTDDHGRILEFLGLEKERWWRKFGSREEMFDYAAGCRMFWVKDFDKVGDAEGVMEGQEGGDAGKKKLKHSDRTRMAKRPIFREWIEEFIPRCREKGRFADSKGVTREQIQEESFVYFGEDVKTEYETRLKEWKLAKHKDDILRLVIKRSIPEDVDPPFRSASIRILKGVIMDGENFEGKKVTEVAANEEGFWDVDEVRAWVVTNWKKAGEIGWTRQQEGAMEGMKAKAQRKRLGAEEDTKKRTKTGVDEVT